MPAEQVARRHYERQQVLVAAAVATAVQAWDAIDAGAVMASWAAMVPEVTVGVASAQALAARTADGYVDEALAAEGFEVPAAGRVQPAAFAGVASDGRRLDTLLVQPALTALGRLGAGVLVEEAMGSGRSALAMIIGTQVADAGRTAVGAAVAARRGVGWVRMLNPPSCSRCAVLAGRRYSFNRGFLRHPRCRSATASTFRPRRSAAGT